MGGLDYYGQRSTDFDDLVVQNTESSHTHSWAIYPSIDPVS